MTDTTSGALPGLRAGSPAVRPAGPGTGFSTRNLLGATAAPRTDPWSGEDDTRLRLRRHAVRQHLAPRRRARAAGGGADAGPVRRHLGLALVLIATAQLMVVLDATIVNVALPDVQRALGFSGTGLEWVVNAYALTFGGLLLLGGRAGDILGRPRMFIAGIVRFSLASLAGGFATTQAWLLAARAVQGASTAAIAPTALSLIATTFPEGPPRNRAM